MLGSSLLANFLLTMNGPRRVTTCFRGSPKLTTGSYPFEEWSEDNTFHALSNSTLNRRTLRSRPIATDRQQHTHTHHATLHHTAPHPITQRRAALDMTRHHTTKKNTKTHTYTHMYLYTHMTKTSICICMCLCTFWCSYFSRRTHSGTRAFHDVYCSKPLTFNNG